MYVGDVVVGVPRANPEQPGDRVTLAFELGQRVPAAMAAVLARP
jgi:hypothetical protein